MQLQDAGQPYMETAVNHRRVRELLSERAVPVLFPGHALSRLPLQYSRFKAGKEHVALYRFELDPPLDAGAPLVTLTFGKRGRLRNAYSHAPSNGEQRAPVAIYWPELPCLIEVFPADAELPLLWHAADPDRAAQLLAPLLPAYHDLRVTQIEVLRYRPGRRCVLRYELTGGELGDIVAKLYGDRDRARVVADKLATLSAQTTPHLKLAARLGELPDNGLLLMERLRGTNLGDQIENSTSLDDNQRAVGAAALGLASFHRFRLQSNERRSLQTELTNLRARLGPVYDVAPALAHDIEALLTGVEQKIAALPPAAECVIHGEFKPNQLLIDGDQMAVVDLDRACVGDPAIDVGNFCAVLRKEVVFEGHEHLAGLDTVFASAYCAANDSAGLIERADLFQTIAFLRMLTRYFERAPQAYARQGEEWRPLVLLAEARRSLDGL